jgi:aldehyde dehydrogenase (NAD+)
MASATQAFSEIEAGIASRTAHGEAGFRAFSHDRTVLRNPFLLLPLPFRPYTPRVMRLIYLIRQGLG